MYGEANMFIDNEAPANDAQCLWTTFYNEIVSLDLCPTDPLVNPGTYFIAVEGLAIIIEVIYISIARSDAAFYITAIPLYIPKPSPPSNSCLIPDEFKEDHICIEDGVAFTLENLNITEYYFVYEFTGCQTIYAYLTCGGTYADLDLYAGKTFGLHLIVLIAIDLSDPYPEYLLAEYESMNIGNDKLIISACSPEGQTNYIFFTVEWENAGLDFTSFSLYVTHNTTNMKQTLTLTSNINQYYYPWALEDTILYLNNDLYL
jgi:hypothetical protein